MIRFFIPVIVDIIISRQLSVVCCHLDRLDDRFVRFVH